MSATLIILTAFAYLCLLFFLAYYGDRRAAEGKSIVNNPYVYALSLAVYCTAWTFYGSVGRAAESGYGFLPVYLGPTIMAPLFLILLYKIILISKNQGLTSLADFIAARYGKSTYLGALSCIILVIGVIPYIALQLKAVSYTYDILSSGSLELNNLTQSVPFYLDSGLYAAIVLTIFTILFGVRKLNPNERHEGLVAAIAFESIVKLLAFLAVGIFVTYGVFFGFSDIFNQSNAIPELANVIFGQDQSLDGWSWFWLTFISMWAILLLPRQFHMAVVENNNVSSIKTAAWVLPLYLFLINLFVLPIALGGSILLQDYPNLSPDTYVLGLPLLFEYKGLALLVFIGGLSAALGMVTVSVISLSIMISNNLILPWILRSSVVREINVDDLSQRLLGIRRVAVVVVIALAYGFYKLIAFEYPLVSIGLISFTAVAQFVPVLLGALFWRGATKKGAISGLLVGFTIWAYTLPFPTLVESGVLGNSIMQEGLWGFDFLRPRALFGTTDMSPIAHAAFWSLLGNTLAFVGVSVFSRPNALELIQASLFVDIFKYEKTGSDSAWSRRKAKTGDVLFIIKRFLGIEQTARIVREFESTHQVNLSQNTMADPMLIQLAEKNLAAALGTASARVIIGRIVREDEVSLGELMEILDQTQEIIAYGKALEQKSQELEETTEQLRLANDQLKELDRLKAEFINTITHELRTPITSIKAFSKILLDNPDLEETKREYYLDIVVTECGRLTRLINQVLDLRKIQQQGAFKSYPKIDLRDLVVQSFQGVLQLFEEKNITSSYKIPDHEIQVFGIPDKLIQVIINLLSNAIKFCHPSQGEILLSLEDMGAEAEIKVWDNGKGIDPKDQDKIFEEFIQLSDRESGKPHGSGLGLYISNQIIQAHHGRITVESGPEEGSTFRIILPKAPASN